MEYTPKQVEDIKAREAKALAYLLELQLGPAVSMRMENIGNDQFVVKPVPYLQDLKYSPKISPIQNVETDKKSD